MITTFRSWGWTLYEAHPLHYPLKQLPVLCLNLKDRKDQLRMKTLSIKIPVSPESGSLSLEPG